MEQLEIRTTLFPVILSCHVDVFRSNEAPDLMDEIRWYRRLQQVNKQEEEDKT